MEIKKQKKSFFFHFNKPSTLRAGKVKVSVHYDKKCHIVDNVVVEVPVQGKARNTSPRFVMRGKANKFKISKGTAYIT